MHQAQTDRHPEKADKVGEQWLRLGLYYSQAHGIGTYSHHKYRGLWMLSYLVWDMMFTFLNVTFKTLQNDPVGHMKIVCTHARSLKHKRETNTGTHLCIHSSKIGRMLKSQSCTPTVWIKCSTWFTGFMHFLRKTWFAEITPKKKPSNEISMKPPFSVCFHKQNKDHTKYATGEHLVKDSNSTHWLSKSSFQTARLRNVTVFLNQTGPMYVCMYDDYISSEPDLLGKPPQEQMDSF